MRYDELYHYGIKGQKWGIRRFQNKDGTRTEEGKKRYSSDPSRLYRNKYGELTDLGKAYDKARSRRFDNVEDYEKEEHRVKKLFDNSPNPTMRDPKFQQKILNIWNDAIYKDYSGEYEEKYKNTQEGKQLKKCEKEANDARRKLDEAERDYIERHPEYKTASDDHRRLLTELNAAWKRDNWKTTAQNEKHIFELQKALDSVDMKLISMHDKMRADSKYKSAQSAYEAAEREYRKARERLSGMGKMCTVKEIMKYVTPELKAEVYAMMHDNWQI